MKIVFFYGNKLNSKLTKLFTGSTCYHVAFTDEVHLWDMHWIRRRRKWDAQKVKTHILVETPVPITAEYLNYQLDTDETTYGWLDYILFGLRPLFHFVGKSTRNASGIICSEQVKIDLIANGWHFPFKEVPSPADLEEVLLGKRDFING